MRAGLRRRGRRGPTDEYQQILAFDAKVAWSEPTLTERTLGDVLDPNLPGSAEAAVNQIAQATGLDAAGWRWTRIVRMAAGLRRQARDGGADVQG